MATPHSLLLRSIAFCEAATDVLQKWRVHPPTDSRCLLSVGGAAAAGRPTQYYQLPASSASSSKTEGLRVFEATCGAPAAVVAGHEAKVGRNEEFLISRARLQPTSSCDVLYRCCSNRIMQASSSTDHREQFDFLPRET